MYSRKPNSTNAQGQLPQFGTQSPKAASFAMLPPSSMIPKPKGSYSGRGMGFSPVPRQKQQKPMPVQQDRWMEGPTGAEQNNLAQAGMDEITRSAGMQAAFEPNVQPGPKWRPGFDPRAMMQQAPMQIDNWARPVDLSQQARSGMNNPVMLEQAGGGMTGVFDNLKHANSKRREMLDNTMESSKRMFLMNGLQSPLSKIAGAFLPQGANQMLQQWGTNGDAMNNGNTNAVMQQMNDMESSGMKTGNFMDNYMRYWDPNSPTNHQQDFQNQMTSKQAYNQALQTQQQGYRDTTGRQQMLGQMDLNQGKQLLDQDQFVNQVQQQGVQNRLAQSQFDQQVKQQGYNNQNTDYQNEMAYYNAMMGHNKEATDANAKPCKMTCR